MADEIEKSAEEFLAALAERIEDLVALAATPEISPDEINFELYQKFRDMMSECLSFLIIIERRIARTNEPKRSELMDRFNELTVAIWGTLLDGSLGFLKVIAAREHLPLGTKHVFVQELKTLHDAEQVLKQDQFCSRMGAQLNSRRETAGKILDQIIDRAPQLLDLKPHG